MLRSYGTVAMCNWLIGTNTINSLARVRDQSRAYARYNFVQYNFDYKKHFEYSDHNLLTGPIVDFLLGFLKYFVN